MEYKGATITKGEIEVPGRHHIIIRGYIVKAETWSTICDSVDIAKRLIDQREKKRNVTAAAGA